MQRNEKDFRYLVGLPIEEAKSVHNNLRIVKEDDKDCTVLQNLDPSRLNIEVKEGKISAIVDFG